MTFDGLYDRKCFTKLVQKLYEQNIDPNDAELALLYRTLCSSFNPLGVYWAVLGVIGSFVFFHGKISRSKRLVTSALSGAYAYEFSWVNIEREPCHSFFVDIASVQGSIAPIAHSFPIIAPPEHLWSSFWEFVTLERTLNALKPDDFQTAWLLFFKSRWFERLEGNFDPLTKSYWRWKVRAAKRYFAAVNAGSRSSSKPSKPNS
jgi:hypothetical protein